MTRIPLLAAAAVFTFTFAFADRGPSSRAPGDASGATRGDGRAAFEAAWEAWARESDGPARDALALEVDRLAGQRYATVSRLYWHQDLESALTAATESDRPILALRMLGRLDEDFSCANSRFFRVALYADRELSDYLREHFELVWTSERPVPVARIDFGDGRVLERTLAGNSAHFVLDRNGRPIDVLPGLYSPAAFRSALEDAEIVARQAATLDTSELALALEQFHRARLTRNARLLDGRGAPSIAAGGEGLWAAEGRALGKSMVERPIVVGFALGAGLPDTVQRQAELELQDWAELTARLPEARLDAASRALFTALRPTDWSRAGQALHGDGIEALIVDFERTLARDSAFNEYGLHDQVSAWFIDGRAPRDLAGLSALVYGELFRTPAGDPWLGMATPDVFSALPGDGVRVAR